MKVNISARDIITARLRRQFRMVRGNPMPPSSSLTTSFL